MLENQSKEKTVNAFFIFILFLYFNHLFLLLLFILSLSIHHQPALIFTSNLQITLQRNTHTTTPFLNPTCIILHPNFQLRICSLFSFLI